MTNEALLAEIRQRLNYEELFGEMVQLHGRGAERTAKCIFHEDTRPSLSVNVVEGLYFCHAADCGARGDAIDFFMRVRSLTFPEAVRELARRLGLDPEAPRRPPPTAEEQDRVLRAYRPGVVLPPPAPPPEAERVVDEAIVDAFHARLLAQPADLAWLAEHRGLTAETVAQFHLGHDGQRYYIPIRDTDGQCVNIRRYRANSARAADKMISWRTGFGTARLFPLDSLTADARPLVLLEGEWDCLLGIQDGLRAITTTGGAGAWREAWNVLFRDQDVVICYDVDDAGRTGARYIAAQLAEIARSVRVIDLPLTAPPGADYTDFRVRFGHSVDEFLALIAGTPPFTPPTVEPKRVDGDPIHMHLSKASDEEHYSELVKFTAMVSGKQILPYFVPREMQYHCDQPALKMCRTCPLNVSGGALRFEFKDFDNNDVLKCVDTSDDKLYKMQKKLVGIPSKCGRVKVSTLSVHRAEKVVVIPEIERTDEEAKYVTREALNISGTTVESNRTYLFTARTVTNPDTQAVAHIITHAIPAQSNIDAFHLTPDVVERLRVFSPPRWDVPTLWEHLDRIYSDLETVTRIYQRRDLMLVVDLAFHSILQFCFQGERLTRGWIEAFALGDTRTGKTSVVTGLMNHYGAGELCSGENTSLPGLVGGLHKIGESWNLNWGRLPLNDRRLLAIDEVSNLPPEQIARLSSLRSSGVAEVTKIHTEKTHSRTRMIAMGNTRAGRPLSSYGQGCRAVKETIGAPEDIARFDLVSTFSSDEVAIDVVNAPRIAEQPTHFTAELCHQRVMWAWSRTAEQVIWAEGAEAAVLHHATVQGTRYRFAAEIPIVEPNEQRIRIARLAVAAAAMFFSASDDGQQLIVRPEHVEFVVQFLEKLFSKPSLSFTEYAAAQTRKYEITDQAEVERLVLRYPGTARALMDQEMFSSRDLEEMFRLSERGELRAAVTTLKEAGFLHRVGRHQNYVKTPAAIRWLRLRLNGGAPHRDLEGLMPPPEANGDGAGDDGQEPPW